MVFAALESMLVV